MKALSVKNPWAALIASGRKTIETRSYVTAYRGPIAIHASLRVDDEPPARAALHAAGYLSAKALPAGRVVAVANLVACEPFEACHADAACTPWRPNAWAWRLENVRRADTGIPVKGQLGLWTIPDGWITVQESTDPPKVSKEDEALQAAGKLGETKGLCPECETWKPGGNCPPEHFGEQEEPR